MSSSPRPSSEPPTLKTGGSTDLFDADAEVAAAARGDMTSFQNNMELSVHRTSPVNEGTVYGPPPYLDTPSYKDVTDSSAVAGVCGFRNLGNTCFMNAGLQCLLCNTRLVKHFLENLPPEVKGEVTLTSRFYTILQKVWCGKYSVIWPSKFKETLGAYFSQFQDFRQHDCQEFLALMLDALHEQLNEARQSRDSPHPTTMAASCQHQPREKCKDEPLNNQKEVQATPAAIGCVYDQSEANNLCWNTSHSAKSDAMCELSQDLALSRAEENMTPMSELSDHSTTSSLQSSESALQNNVLRMQTIPCECVISEGERENAFKPIEATADCATDITQPTVSNNTESITISTAGATHARTNDNIPHEEDSGNQGHLPSIEDLYMKDTKTKNVNVVVADIEESPSYDSDKFPTKHDFTASNSQYDSFSSLNEMAAYVAKPSPAKDVKSTNLLSNMANNREKFGGESLKVKFNSMEVDDDATCSINNIKRKKMDDTPKNIKQEAKRKVNVSKNILRDNVQGCDHITDQVAMGSGDGAKTNTIPSNSSPTDAVIRANKALLDAQDVLQAEKAWQQYISRNCSVVVDTFQGQFKNQVVCCECHHVSVTYEPFMYLSVPLPHAMDRQISVIFIPCDMKRPMRYLVTLHKQDTILSMKKALQSIVDTEIKDIIVAEVSRHLIFKILEDHHQLKSVNDQARKIYAFEMEPRPNVDDSSLCTEHGASSDLISNDNTLATFSQPCTIDVSVDFEKVTSSVSSPGCNNTHGDGVCKGGANDVFTTMGVFDSNMICNYDTPDNDSSVDTKPQNSPAWGEFVASDWPGTDADKSNDWIEPEADWSQEAVMDQSESCLTTLEPDDYDMQCSQQYTSSWLADLNKMEAGQSDGPTSVATMATTGSGDESKLAEVWKMCAICLEDIPSVELLTHPACGGTLCNSCYDMSLKHYGDTNFTCPICSTSVKPSTDFVPLNSAPEFKPKPRVLSVPVVFRLTTEADDHLFAHPRLLYLCSRNTGVNIYHQVSRILPVDAKFVVKLTDNKGLHCSRCVYTAHCTGCQVPRDGDVNLITGDNLSVTFSSVTASVMEDSDLYDNHVSMKNLRPNEPLSLFDCLQAFAESEILDEHNPWFCPNCNKNQCAKKTLSVWTFPDTLVIYLKRFVYHELSSTKVDSPVTFPFENLDVSDYLSAPDITDTMYDLQAAVCHFGSTSSGHYTAYCKHPLGDDWYYYNDESTSQQAPAEDVYSNAYILFYQRQGSHVQFTLPEKPCDIEPSGAVKAGCTSNTINPETFSQLLQGLAETSTVESKQDDDDGGHSLDFYG